MFIYYVLWQIEQKPLILLTFHSNIIKIEKLFT